MQCSTAPSLISQEQFVPAGIGTIRELEMLTEVAGLHRASPSASLDKRLCNDFQLTFTIYFT
jgi:hypothetical protein